MLSLTYCPEPTCGALAEITDRRALGSTDGLIEHVTTFCLQRHRFTVPTERLAPAMLGQQ